MIRRGVSFKLNMPMVIAGLLLVLPLLGSGALAGLPGGPAGQVPAAPSKVETAALRGYRGSWYQAYFTKPAYPQGAANRQGGLDAALVADIARAKQSIHVASFDLDLETIVDALIRAHTRGVEVHVSIDGENLATPDVSFTMGQLEDAGIAVFYDKRSAFMHDKIVLIDNRIVWTGSWNLTVNDTFRNNNNMLRIENAQVAAAYRAKLDAIHKGDGGPHPGSVVRYRKTRWDDATVHPLFAPEDPITGVIVQQIDVAQKQVDVLAFAFTSEPIAQALIQARTRGVAVRVVMERRNTLGTGSKFATLRAAGIDIHADGNCYVMHHKVVLVDGQRMVTGSFNFTDAAQEQNDENVVVIRDNDLAALYEAEFERVRNQALNPTQCEE